MCTQNGKDFTHRIYVDFSGDDGDPNTLGASKTICMAWVLSSESDIHHNQGVVLKIKKRIGCRATDELKYTTLRRHRERAHALGLLSQLKANVVVVAVLKERISDQRLRSPSTKRLVNLIHYFPLSGLLDHFERTHSSGYFQLVFDEIGWQGCREAIVESYRKESRLNWEEARSDWLLFAKSGSNLMLQLADVLAGMGREYVEGLENQRVPICRVCWVRRKAYDCSYTRNKETVGKEGLMRILYPLLLKGASDKAWENGFVARPPSVKEEYLFVDCLFGTQKS